MDYKIDNKKITRAHAVDSVLDGGVGGRVTACTEKFQFMCETHRQTYITQCTTMPEYVGYVQQRPQHGAQPDDDEDGVTCAIARVRHLRARKTGYYQPYYRRFARSFVRFFLRFFVLENPPTHTLEAKHPTPSALSAVQRTPKTPGARRAHGWLPFYDSSVKVRRFVGCVRDHKTSV